MGGARSSRAAIARQARLTLHDSKAKDSANRKATTEASNHSPMVAAPTTAMVISKFMSGRKRRAAYHAFGRTNQAPARMPRP